VGAYAASRVAAMVGAAATATLLALGVTAAGAEEPPPDETSTVPETTIPSGTDTTIPGPGSGPTSTIVDPPVTGTSTTTSTTTGEGEGPTTTEQAPGEPATTTTLPPVPPSTDLACEGPWPSDHTFLIDESIEEGETFDDPASDFLATFTQVDFVEDHLVVTFEASHPVRQLNLAGLYDLHQIAFFYEGAEPVVVRTVELAPAFGRSIVWAAFCLDAQAVGATPPPSPTDTPNPTEGGAPVVETDLTPVDAAPSGGRLPDTGNDALPLALAGAGLVAVGGALLLGRRMRRSAA
jgi:LPXTG-motif cell wall-anchored protein